MVAEESLSQALGCNLNYFIIVNKDNPSSICVLNVFHILWFDKHLCFSILYMIYLTQLYIYMYHLVSGRLALDRRRRSNLEDFGAKAEQKRTSKDRLSLNE